LTLNRPRALLFPLWGQWLDHWARADLKGAQRIAAELRELGEAARDAPMQVIGCDTGGYTCFQLGEFDTARAYHEKALALYDPSDRACYAALLPQDARVHLLIHSLSPLACLGHLDQALSQRDAALEEARRLCHPHTLAFTLAVAVWVPEWWVRLEPGSLLQYADEALALTTEHGLGFFRAMAFMEREWCLAALGRAHEGIPLLAAGLAGWDESGLIIWNSWGLTLLGDACRIVGRWQTALDHLAEARRLADETGDRWCQAGTLRLTGDVQQAMGDHAAAEASYHEAIAIAQQQSAKLWELCAAMSLARLWRDQGKGTEAHALLGRVYGWFTEGFGTPVLQEAKALLDELSAASTTST
jgi:tetratricopeptide (TPR) repeat protein